MGLVTGDPVAATAAAVAAVLRHRRYPLRDEREAHALMAADFAAAGLAFERERILGPGERPDFLFPLDPADPGSAGIALEVKVKGSKRAIHDQCARYCAHGAVAGLVLATSVATGFPAEIHGKPCWVLGLGTAWL